MSLGWMEPQQSHPNDPAMLDPGMIWGSNPPPPMTGYPGNPNPGSAAMQMSVRTPDYQTQSQGGWGMPNQPVSTPAPNLGAPPPQATPPWMMPPPQQPPMPHRPMWGEPMGAPHGGGPPQGSSGGWGQQIPPANTSTSTPWGQSPTPGPGPMNPPQQAAWGAPQGHNQAPGNSSNWRDVVSKNVPANQGPPGRGEGGWGGKTVNQETPWGDAGGGPGGDRTGTAAWGAPKQDAHQQQQPQHHQQKAQWNPQQQNGPHSYHQHHQQHPSNAAANEWQQPPPTYRENPDLNWNGPPQSDGGGGGQWYPQGGPGPGPRGRGGSSGGGAGWDGPRGMQQQQQQQQQQPPNSMQWENPNPSRNQYNDNRRGGRDSMHWEDPSPKPAKIIVPDKGISCWGDPNQQGIVKRWKNHPDEGTQPAEQPSTPVSAAVEQPWNSSDISATSQSGGWPAEPGKSSTSLSPKRTSVAGWPDTPTDHVNGSGGWGSDSVFPAGQGYGGQTPAQQQAAVEQNKQQNVIASLIATQNQQNPVGLGNPELQNHQKAQAIQMIIADRIKTAITAGLIKTDVLSKPLPNPSLLLLNQLLEYIPKIESAEKELNGLKGGQYSPQQQQEMQRVTSELGKMKQDVADIQARIRESQEKPASMDSTPIYPEAPWFGSKGISNDGSMPIHNKDPSQRLTPNGLSVPSDLAGALLDPISNLKLTNNTPNAQARVQDATDSKSLPPPFEPGKPWLLPQGEVVDDNTTPQDLKQRKFQGISIADPAHDIEQRLGSSWASSPGKNSVSSDKGMPLFAALANAQPQQQQPPQAAFAQRSLSTPQGGSNKDWSPSANSGNQWIVLMNVPVNTDENVLHATCKRAGGVKTFIYQAGGQFAVVNYHSNVGLETIVPLLQQELSPQGITVQLAKDSEIERLVSSTSAPIGGHISSGWGSMPEGRSPWDAPRDDSGDMKDNGEPGI